MFSSLSNSCFFFFLLLQFWNHFFFLHLEHADKVLIHHVKSDLHGKISPLSPAHSNSALPLSIRPQQQHLVMFRSQHASAEPEWFFSCLMLSDQLQLAAPASAPLSSEMLKLLSESLHPPLCPEIKDKGLAQKGAFGTLL